MFYVITTICGSTKTFDFDDMDSALIYVSDFSKEAFLSDCPEDFSIDFTKDIE